MHQFENLRSKPRAMHTFETMQIRCLCQKRTMHQDLSFGVEILVDKVLLLQLVRSGKRASRMFLIV
jgi:hypothetical protein